jgi:hypothetical protein
MSTRGMLRLVGLIVFIGIIITASAILFEC